MNKKKEVVPRHVRSKILNWEKSALRGTELVAQPIARYAQPHSSAFPLYYVPLLALVNGQNLSAALKIGWCHIVVSSDRAHIVRIDAISDRDSKFVHALNIPMTHSVYGALKQLDETLPRLKSKEWILYGLTIPPLVTFALWLRRSKGNQEIIPIASNLGGVRDKKPMSESSFFRRLAGQARTLLEHANTHHTEEALNDTAAVKIDGSR